MCRTIMSNLLIQYTSGRIKKLHFKTLCSDFLSLRVKLPCLSTEAFSKKIPNVLTNEALRKCSMNVPQIHDDDGRSSDVWSLKQVDDAEASFLPICRDVTSCCCCCCLLHTFSHRSSNSYRWQLPLIIFSAPYLENHMITHSQGEFI